MPLIVVVVFPKDTVLEPPFNVPAVRVQVPENECVNPDPKFNVPPEPFIVRPAAETLPVNVAVPAVFVIETVPVVVKPAIDWVEAVPDIVIPPEPLVNVPEFVKLP